MELLVVLVVAVVAVAIIVAPLRRKGGVEATESAELADLVAAKDAKLHEIRDAQLDYRLGKISEDDWRALDAGLRQEAVALLREVDAESLNHPRG